MIPKRQMQFSTMHIYNMSSDFFLPCNSNWLLYCTGFYTVWAVLQLHVWHALGQSGYWRKVTSLWPFLWVQSSVNPTVSQSRPRFFSKIRKIGMYVCFCPILKKKWKVTATYRQNWVSAEVIIHIQNGITLAEFQVAKQVMSQLFVAAIASRNCCCKEYCTWLHSYVSLELHK